MTDNRMFIDKVNELLKLADNVLNNFQADNIIRLRASTELLIVSKYGKNSVLYKHYSKIGSL